MNNALLIYSAIVETLTLVFAALSFFVTYSHHLRGGGFSLNSPIGLSLNELSPCAPRFFLFVQVMR